MKSAPVKSQSPSLHSLIKRSTATRKERQAPQKTGVMLLPTEEKIVELNNLGKQYPYCVNFKHKRHDPL